MPSKNIATTTEMNKMFGPTVLYTAKTTKSQKTFNKNTLLYLR